MKEKMENYPDKLKALIDGDEVIYRAGFASQHQVYNIYPIYDEEDGHIASFPYKAEADEYVEKYGGKENFTVIKTFLVDSSNIAISNAKQYIKKILEETNASDYCLYFSGSENFRMNIATLLPYKGNRPEDGKPYYYSLIKEYLQENYKWELSSNLEADDLLSINQWKDYEEVIKKFEHDSEEFKQNLSTIICTNDKDLDMIPGWRYRRGELIYIDGPTSTLNFYTQLLTGDMTDNIPGLYQLTGSRASKKIKDGLYKLSEPKDMYNYIRDVYISAFGCDRERTDVDIVLKEIATLLWMKRNLKEEVLLKEWLNTCYC